ncbi:MAG TPA: DNA-formamidopyrimidine glycosylase family protein [Mucilaginibacter sp.]|nr:DNA-formamidopyrimidine glycosylase family protein [Mucilaginibacter sp.]
MPELPDLQVFSRNLNKLFKGKKLEKISIKVHSKLNVPEADVQHALQGQKLSDVMRVGKELQFEFANGHILATHLMLHGQLHTFEKTNTHKFTIVKMLFEGDKGLALTDFQKAATPALDPQKQEAPDALDFDDKYLQEKLSSKRTAIKTVLMDQKILRGIGNAYADEILYDARLSPFSASNKIPAEKVRQLSKSIRKVLENAEEQILKNHPDIISGEYRDFLQVHQPKKKTTPAGETIHQKTVGSRKTYYTDAQEEFN